MSRQGEIAERPARAQPSSSSTNDHAFTVIELIEMSARSCDRSRITPRPPPLVVCSLTQCASRYLRWVHASRVYRAASYAAHERTKLGALPLPIWGEGWGEGVTGGTDGSEPPHPFLRVARESSPLPGGERARAAIARLRHVTASRLHAARGEHSAHAQRRAV